jgi:hypothetical protein
MTMERGTIIGLGLAAVLMTATQGLAAGSKGVLTVSASVKPTVAQTVIRQAGSLNVTIEDIKRGYVEVASGTVLQVKSNSLGGYKLVVAVNSGMVEEVWVTEKSRTTVLSPSGGFIHQPRAGAEVKDLSFRFVLSPDAQPGRHPWPVSLSASIQ